MQPIFGNLVLKNIDHQKKNEKKSYAFVLERQSYDSQEKDGD